MSVKTLIFKRIILTLILFLCLVSWLLVPPVFPKRMTSLEKHVLLTEVMTYVVTMYVDPLPPDSLLDGAIRSMLRKSRLDGTGIYVRASADTLVVWETTPAYSTDKGELKKGDRILSVHGLKIVGLHPDSLEKAEIYSDDSLVIIEVFRKSLSDTVPEVLKIELHKPLITFHEPGLAESMKDINSVLKPGDDRSDNDIKQFLTKLMQVEMENVTKKGNKKYSKEELLNEAYALLGKHPKWNVLMDIQRASLGFYSDSLEQNRLIDTAVEGIMECLDPHSRYLPPVTASSMKERIRGNFEGIGIRYDIRTTDTLTVIEPIRGTPAYLAGIRSRDKIIAVNDTSIIGASNDVVQKKLRGLGGTTVDVSVLSPGIQKPLTVTLTRGEIPLYRVPYAFILKDDIGYIRINQFSVPTAGEFEEALEKLEMQGMKHLMLDLRGNQGGAMSSAYEIADMFIDSGKIVSQKMRRITKIYNKIYNAKRETTHKPQYPIIVMINHGSASASEIVAGALQDKDRALIVGQTSFGKGLVQNPIPLSNSGGTLLLTVAKYYTPSGRLIQRPYDSGRIAYIKEGYDDYDPNAVTDTIPESNKYLTDAGRTVYGGGGITPDIMLEPNKSLSDFERKIFRNTVVFHYADSFITRHPEIPRDFEEFFANYTIPDKELTAFRDYIREKLSVHDVEFTDEEFEESKDFVIRSIKQEIARALWGNEEYYRFWIRVDDEIHKSLSLFDEAERILNLQSKTD